MLRFLQILLVVLLVACAWLGAAWWVSLESRQEAVLEVAAGDPYALAEAAGFAEAQWGLTRIAALLLCIVLGIALFRCTELVPVLTAAAEGFREILRTDIERGARWRSRLLTGVDCLLDSAHRLAIRCRCCAAVGGLTRLSVAPR